ncbi:uncharacterized protein TNCV_1125551 [Trichonephila clavipes]|nr:uncharacterized protein TNCV_1125551 [Trichonephila clavipes]
MSLYLYKKRRGMIESGPKYAGSDLFRGPNMDTRKDKHLYCHRTTRSKRHGAAEGRPVRSEKMTTVRPCPYYLMSRLKEPEGITEEQMSTGIDILPQNSLRRRSLSMEALDGDPEDRSE